MEMFVMHICLQSCTTQLYMLQLLGIIFIERDRERDQRQNYYLHHHQLHGSRMKVIKSGTGTTTKFSAFASHTGRRKGTKKPHTDKNCIYGMCSTPKNAAAAAACRPACPHFHIYFCPSSFSLPFGVCVCLCKQIVLNYTKKQNPQFIAPTYLFYIRQPLCVSGVTRAIRIFTFFFALSFITLSIHFTTNQTNYNDTHTQTGQLEQQVCAKTNIKTRFACAISSHPTA